MPPFNITDVYLNKDMVPYYELARVKVLPLSF